MQSMVPEKNVLVIGGGLAGLTAALHLNKSGMDVTLIERHGYPRHKVCGEYVSNEVLPYFDWLGVDFRSLAPSNLHTLRYTTLSGRAVECGLPLGGFGLSRYAMDQLLYRVALARGVKVIFDAVREVGYHNDRFSVATASGSIYKAAMVLGAFGKLSALSKKGKNTDRSSSPSVGVKAHYRYDGDFPTGEVSLNNFSGGYCGVSMVENRQLNICYLADYASFRKSGGIKNFQQNVLNRNRFLKEVLERSTILGQGPISVGQLSFASQPAVQDHMLMIGDTAGLIHPLCGNGMAMAVGSAKLSCELVVGYLRDGLINRREMETGYQKAWKDAFGGRMWAGRMLSGLGKSTVLQGLAMEAVGRFPLLLKKMIESTHGKPISVKGL
ncbi:MAG: NAD(P)/FAD-dependent oxidoreductase [Chitinophagaceae bacterium]|nr:MAG: NAD(P)/FAD-dependent oxidoreductase [Chitinophagaceae bacterium]